MLSLRLSLSLCIAGLATGAAMAQEPCEQVKLLPSDGGFHDRFGIFVRIDGDVAIAGAITDDDAGPETGSAYIFRFDPKTHEWIEEVKILADDAQPDDWFGQSVAISGDVAVIGSGRDDNGETIFRVHILRYDGKVWNNEQLVELPVISVPCCVVNQPYPVAISGNVIVVGVHGLPSDPIPISGEVHVLRYDGDAWAQEATIVPSDGEAHDHFGFSVAIGDGVMIVGSPADDDNGNVSGSAYIFRYDADGKNWIEESKLLASDGDEEDQFGWSVALRGDVAVVGANLDDAKGGRVGSAYVFRFDSRTSTWIEEEKLLAADVTGWAFGSAVAIGEGLIVAGAEAADGNGPNEGAAYLFRKRGAMWVEEAKFLGSDGPTWGFFGMTLAVSGDRLFVGAPHDDDNGEWSGSAYMFDLEPFPGDLDCNGSVGVSDLLILLANWGPCGDCDDCPADLDGDCSVGVADLLILLANWG